MSVEFQSGFDELMKARRASVGEIRVWNDGKKYIKTPKGWVPIEKTSSYGKKDVIWHENKFGENYSEYTGKPKEALDFLINKKNGQVRNAWERDDIGDIDIVYGKKAFGLKHIIGKHVGITEDGKEKDFKDEKELTSTVDKLLREGKLIKDYVDENGFRKRILSLGKHALVITQTIVVDDEDNLKEKRWIVTSYDPTRTMREKGIRKAVSEETALEKEVIDSHSLSIQRKKDAPLVAYSSPSFSLPKDTTNTNDMQQFMDEIIEKSKKGAPIGTERTYSNGKTYVKTENGWKPKSGAKKTKKEDDQTEKTSSKVNDVNSYASKASDEQLQAAINDKDALPEVKQAAQKEIESRKDKTSDDKSADELGITSALQRILDAQEKGELDLGLSVINKIKEKLAKNKEEKKNKPIDEKTLDSKLDKLKQDISDSIDKKLNEINGFKKITQTYVKVDGQTIVLNMKGEDKYKAKKGSFYMESKPNEPLNEFKKRVKEEFEKTLKKESKQEPVVESKKPESTKVEEKNNLKFEIEEEFREFLKKRNSQNDTLPDDQRERFAKILDSVTIDEYIEREFKDFIKNEEFNKILEKYAKLKTEYRAAVNKMLIDSGYLPVANGVLYSEWNNVKYKNFTGSILEDKTEMERYYKEQGKKLKVTKTQSEALKRYMGTDYEVIRDYNYGKGGGKNTPLIAQAIAEVIDKNPCKENLVLYRRLEARKINSLNELLNVKVGSIIEDKSFGSFSLKQLNEFGSDFQITLLAKKGDKVANINNVINEYEYLTQRLSKFKVLAKGLNSIVVEMV